VGTDGREDTSLFPRSALVYTTVHWFNCLSNWLIVLNTQRLCPSQLRRLHWLPVYFHINYEIATLTSKIFTVNQPLYLNHFLAACTPGSTLRSQEKLSLSQPAVSTATSSRDFSYAAPSMWNRLPLEIRNSFSFASFKTNLETHTTLLDLFNSSRLLPLVSGDFPRLRFCLG